MNAAEFVIGPIVVGTDGSNPATEAVRWAARAAALRNVPLRIVHAVWYADRVYDGDAALREEVYAGFQAEAARILAGAADEAKAVAGELVPETTMPAGMPVPALIEQSRAARMVVLGTSGQGAVAGLLIGSTPVGVASHAACPMVVVRHAKGAARPPEGGPVVVGVDGSPLSEQAIVAAFEEASLRGADLVAVHARLDAGYEGVFGGAGEDGARERDARRLLAERMAGWQEEYPDVRVEHAVVRAKPRDYLLDRSRTAQLVVVGSRGRGGFRGLVLGSTSQALVHHAECPVLIARTAERG